MKYFAKSSLGVLAALSLLPATAQAGTYSPSTSGGTTQTVVHVKKGLTLLLTLTATISPNGSITTTLPSGTEVATLTIDRQSVVSGKVVSVRCDLGCHLYPKKT